MKMTEMGIETLEVAGIYPAILGMRNPLDSWDRMDSEGDEWCYGGVMVGEKDMVLAKKLIKAGGEHRKFLRQIQVWANVNMPRYIWQEVDTYKFGTKNSCSTMHTIMKTPITIENFYLGQDPIMGTVRLFEDSIIPQLNFFRERYLEEKDYRYVVEMKLILPESFLQMRTWNTNYEELRNIYHQRKYHKLTEEWGTVCNWISTLPYSQELILDTK